MCHVDNDTGMRVGGIWHEKFRETALHDTRRVGLMHRYGVGFRTRLAGHRWVYGIHCRSRLTGARYV